MRPLRLVMRAFGPYPAEEVIDFRPLGDGALFLICGSTGSGKSTIIDAMAFALYGEACSEDRDGRGSRSHLATPDRITEIVFDFALGPERYRLVRRPEQERPKKQRREGITVEKQSAELWRRTQLPPGDDLLEGEPLAARWEAVNEKIAALLGFDCQQFRQVIVLPQGRFRDLLTADVRAREEIFEKLFRTSIYSALQERLKERARGIDKEHETLKTRRGEVLRQAGVETPEALGLLQEENRAQFGHSTQEREGLARTVDEAHAKLNKARDAAAKFAEFSQAVSHFDARQLALEQAAPKRAEAKLARLAAPVQVFGKVALQRETEWLDLTKRLEQGNRELEEATRAAAIARAGWEVEETREPEREAGAASLAWFAGLICKVGALAKLAARVAEAEQAAATRQQQTLASRNALLNLERELEAKARERVQHEQTAAQAGPLAARLETLTREAALHADLRRGVGELVACENQQRDAALARVHAEETCARFAAELERLETAQRDGRAALLARTLTAETPCPVCGSQHHPQPATTGNALPSDAEIAAAKRAFGQAETRLQQTRETVAAVEKKMAGFASQVAGWTQMLGDAATVSPAAMSERLTLTRQASAAAVAAWERLAGLSEIQTGLQARREAWRSALPGEEAAERMAAAEAQKLAAELSAYQQDVPPELRTPETLRSRVAREEKALKALRDAHEAARMRVADTLRRADAAEERCKGLIGSVNGAAAALQRARDELAAELARAGFPDLGSLRAAVRSPEQTLAIDDAVRAADEEFAAARDRRTRAEAAVAGLPTPDVAACEASHRTADETLRQHIGAEAAIKQRGLALAAAERSLDAIERELAAARQQYEVFGTLAEAANGQNGHKLTLQRYVLGALLDDVLVAATRRLLVMSRGRFRLLRQTAPTDGRTAAGLALEVLDEWTGKLRPVGTLSGGESFLAALSLALGLADVVQAYAGGVRMEAMFIDEGFGSLDPEALDFAFQALLDLQRGGRLVGIISHVEELKQRIDQRLEIRATRQGSTTAFVGVASMGVASGL